MTPELRKNLLERMFSSKEYYLKMMDYYEKALNGALEAMDWFESNEPTEDPSALKTAYAWRARALPNMLGYLKGKEEDIERYDQGDLDYVAGTAHNIMTLSRNLDHVGDKWWEYVPREIAYKWGKNMTKAEQMASNIWHTVGD
ncbi:MAG TPA: hypothetical protein ENK29_01860, partial [Chromatiales bacterium]|nr:hypothetical protein [Chromatiales bacterium]